MIKASLAHGSQLLSALAQPSHLLCLRFLSEKELDNLTLSHTADDFIGKKNKLSMCYWHV